MKPDTAEVDDGRIPRINADDTPWLANFAKFCLRNEPCVLSEAFTADWSARELWVRDDGSPNLDYLRKEYGEFLVDF